MTRTYPKWPLLVICLLPGCGNGNHAFCSRTKLQSENIGRVVFQTAITNCDVLGNDTIESITATDKSGRKAVVFSFDPDERSPQPQISAAGGRVLISLPSASSIVTQETQFGTLKIDYRIGHVEYGSKGP